MSHHYNKQNDYNLYQIDEHDPVKKPKKKKEEEMDLKVYPIDIDESKLNQGEPKYPLSSPVHLHLVIGRVKAGKSLLVSNLYLSERFFKDDFETRILVSTTAFNDAINQHMIKEFDFIFTDYSEELLNEIVKMIEKDEGDGRFLILFDDIIGNVNFSRGRTDAISSLITKFRHIGNGEVEGKLSICLTTQYFKYISTIARNNATAYYIMGTFPEGELKKMSESLSFFGGGDKEFLEIYNRSRQEEYDFTYLSVEHLEARRNHENLIWSKKEGFVEPFNEGKDPMKEIKGIPDADGKIDKLDELDNKKK
tara:strand:- start:539 stop:1462 length:924 start_codon:yes stop_codon:yes gene_type:complete